MKNQLSKETWKFTLFTTRFSVEESTKWRETDECVWSMNISSKVICVYVHYFFEEKRGKKLYLGELKIYNITCICTKNMLFTSSRYVFFFNLLFVPPLHHSNERFFSLSFYFNMQFVFFHVLSFIFILLNAIQNVQTFFYFILFLFHVYSIPLQWRVFHFIFPLVLVFLLNIYIKFYKDFSLSVYFFLFFNFK